MTENITHMLMASVVSKYLRVAVAGALGVVVGAAISYGLLTQVLIPKPKSTASAAGTTSTSTFARSVPIELTIDKIDLQTTFVEPLDLQADQTIEVPDSYEQVGWYKNGATPGEIGPAVILGHVDSIHGPAIFYSLPQLEPGDQIKVKRADGTVAVFAVTELKQYNQNNFPTEEVYGAIDYAGLRLVTCTGIFNHWQQRYSHNLVVYAHLIE